MPAGAGGADALYRVYISVESNSAVALRRVGDEVDRFGRKANAKVGLASQEFKGLGNAVLVAGKRIAAFARRYAAMASTIAGAAVIFKSVSDAQKFGIAIAEIGTIFEGSADQLAQIEQGVLGLAQALGINEEIAAKGFYQIISSDITDAAEAMLVLTEGTKLATVGLADAKDTVNLLTSVIKAYQRPVEDAADITNVLFRTVIKGKTTVPELATSLGQVLPIAATLGIELEEVAAALATLTQGGLQTNTATIQLRQAMNQLLKPAAEAEEVMARFGLNVDVATIREEGFVEVLRRIEEAIGDNAGAMAKLFGNVRGLIPVLALTGKQADQFRRTVSFIGEDFDKVGEALDKFLETPFKKFQRFFNSVRLQLRRVGEVFIRAFTDEIDKRGGIDAVVERIGAAFAGLESAAETAARAMGAVLMQLEMLIKRFGGLSRAQTIFREFGALISNAVNVAFQTLVGTFAVFVELLLRLPELVQGMLNSLQNLLTGFNFVPGIHFDVLVTKSMIQKEIDEKWAFATALWKARQRHFGEDIEAAVPEEFPFFGQRGVITDFGRQLLGGAAMEGEYVPAMDQALSEALEARVRLIDAWNDAPEDVQSVSLSMASLTDAFGPAKDAIDATTEAYTRLGDALSAPLEVPAPPPPLERFMVPLPDDIVQPIVPEISDQDRARFHATLGELQILAEAFDIEVPIDFRLRKEDVSRQAVQDFVDFLEASGELPTTIVSGVVSEDFVADADRVRAAMARSVELLEMQDSLMSGLRDTEVARSILGEKLAGLRKAELEETLRTLNATKETRDVVLALFGADQRQSAADLLGFVDIETELEKASRGLTDTLEKQRAALDKNNAALELRALKLLGLGVIEGEGYQRILATTARALEQFEEKSRRALFDQEAFQGIDALGLLFEDMEREAKMAAFEITGIGKAANEIEFRQLRAAFNAAMDEMSQGADAFFRGFRAGWVDTVRVMNDSIRSGADTARSVLEGLNSSFSEALSGFIQGDEKAFEAFQEAFAQSLADSVAQALTDALVGTVADVIAQAFASKIQESVGEALIAKAAEGFAAGGPAGAAVGAGAAVAGEGAKAVTEAAAEAGQVATAVSAALAPVAAALTGAASSITAAAGVASTAAGALQLAGGSLQGAALALDAAAGALAAAAAGDLVPGATGGVFPALGAPVVKPFAMGGITRVENLAAGGIRHQETFARIAEAGRPEAVVPLPGNGREIPVDLRVPRGVSIGRVDAGEGEPQGGAGETARAIGMAVMAVLRPVAGQFASAAASLQRAGRTLNTAAVAMAPGAQAVAAPMAEPFSSGGITRGLEPAVRVIQTALGGVQPGALGPPQAVKSFAAGGIAGARPAPGATGQAPPSILVQPFAVGGVARAVENPARIIQAAVGGVQPGALTAPSVLIKPFAVGGVSGPLGGVGSPLPPSVAGTQPTAFAPAPPVVVRQFAAGGITPALGPTAETLVQPFAMGGVASAATVIQSAMGGLQPGAVASPAMAVQPFAAGGIAGAEPTGPALPAALAPTPVIVKPFAAGGVVQAFEPASRAIAPLAPPAQAVKEFASGGIAESLRPEIRVPAAPAAVVKQFAIGGVTPDALEPVINVPPAVAAAAPPAVVKPFAFGGVTEALAGPAAALSPLAPAPVLVKPFALGGVTSLEPPPVKVFQAAAGGVQPGALTPPSVVSRFEDGGIAAPLVRPFALGGITGPVVENLATGGIRHTETFARIAEAGRPEAVVPLPGDGRHIPVEFRNAPQMGGETNVNTNLTLVFEGGGDPVQDITRQARLIEDIVERALVTASNRGLKIAVRRAAGGL